VVLDGDGATGRPRSSLRDVLVEGRRAQDGRLIGTSVRIDGVSPTIARDRALILTGLGDACLIFHDVVFDEGIFGPAVDGETAETTADSKCTRVGNGEIASRVPSYSDDEIFLSIPSDRELIGPRRVANGPTSGIVLIVVCVGTTRQGVI